MIFIANADGSIKAVLPSNVYQNSNLANRVVLFAPFTSATKVSVAFNLPNGNNTARLLTQQDSIEMSKYDIASSELAENYSMWFYDLPQMITSISGDVSVQFFIYNGTQTIATSSQIFNVYNGIDYIEENINEDQYSELLNLVSRLEAFVDNLNNTTVKKENVATINGQSIINGGNVEINTLTEEEKEKLDKIVVDGDGTKYLSDDGTYKEVAGGSSVTVDSELSTESTNPVQNKVIAEALDGKLKVLKGEGKPTAETVGELGQFYIDTTTGETYQYEPTSESDTKPWKIMINASNFSDGYGIRLSNINKVTFVDTPNKYIDERNTYLMAVTCNKINYAVMKGLTEPTVGNGHEWTDEQKALARQTIGATKLYKHIISLTSDFDNAYIIFYSLSNENEYLDHNQENIWIKGENLISQPYLYARLGTNSVVVNGWYASLENNITNMINISGYNLNITSVSEVIEEV